MTEPPFLRNHWSMVASNTVKSLVAIAIVLLITLGMGNEFHFDLYLLMVALMVGLLLAVNIIVWKRTKYYFLDDELVVKRSTIIRSETRIQYDRLASVNVERDAVCRILGATKLSFNLNSSVNASSAEAFIVLRKDEAEKLRRDMDARIFGRAVPVSEEPIEEAEPESLVHVSVWDILLHSVFGMSSGQFGLGMFMLAYSVGSFVYGGSITFFTTILFILDFLLPAVTSFFRLYRYRITRSGDAVSVSSGFFSTREDAFMLSKVNYVKVREPLLCRLMGRVILEVEVVG
ncbi:MAG: PH domain-containing protein, partial [Candidatus Methanomethylophilaceae archaeon]|nr:PH domain-containing protein [Candidatus Methanomethylophilaceae archaeon]